MATVSHGLVPLNPKYSTIKPSNRLNFRPSFVYFDRRAYAQNIESLRVVGLNSNFDRLNCVGANLLRKHKEFRVCVQVQNTEGITNDDTSSNPDAIVCGVKTKQGALAWAWKKLWDTFEFPVHFMMSYISFSRIAVMLLATKLHDTKLIKTWVEVCHTLFFIIILQKLTIALITSLGLVDRDKLLTSINIYSVFLFVMTSIALVEGYPESFHRLGWIVGCLSRLVGLMAKTLGSKNFKDAVVAILQLGGVGAAIAARHVVYDFVNGIIMKISPPFSVGDTIKVGSVEGQVVEIGLTNTKILTEEKLHRVPNSCFSTQVIQLNCKQNQQKQLYVELSSDREIRP